MTTETTYNGWKNYETWAVKLWIDNEQPSYEFWQHQTSAVWRNAEHDHGETFTRSEYARITLADELKEWSEDRMPDLGANVWADLLNAALSEVDWFEIADNLLSDTDDYQPS